MITEKSIDRINGLKRVSPNKLLAHPDNWRVHSEYQRSVLNDAINEIGWIKPIIVSKKSGLILDGHLRVSVAKERREKTVPVIYVDVDESQEKIALASLDSITALADIDYEALQRVTEGSPVEGNGLSSLLADLTDEAVSALSNLDAGIPSVGGRSKLTSHKRASVKVVIMIDDVSVFERAMQSTGLPNRADAFLKICGDFNGTERQHDPIDEDGIAAKITQAIESGE